MRNNAVYLIIGVIAIAIIGLFAFTGTDTEKPDTTSTPDIQEEVDDKSSQDNESDSDEADVDSSTSSEETPSGEPSTVTVTYTNNGFSPSTATVDVGTTVVFENQSSSGMWVASDEHPTHTHYSGTTLRQHCSDGSDAFDACTEIGAGSSWAFTFNKSGQWSYHDHRSPNRTGTIIVE